MICDNRCGVDMNILQDNSTVYDKDIVSKIQNTDVRHNDDVNPLVISNNGYNLFDGGSIT